MSQYDSNLMSDDNVEVVVHPSGAVTRWFRAKQSLRRTGTRHSRLLHRIVRSILPRAMQSSGVSNEVQVDDDATAAVSNNLQSVFVPEDVATAAGYGNDADSQSFDDPPLELTRESLAILATVGSTGLFPSLANIDLSSNQFASSQMALEPICRLSSAGSITALDLSGNGMFGLIPHCIFARMNQL